MGDCPLPGPRIFPGWMPGPTYPPPACVPSACWRTAERAFRWFTSTCPRRCSECLSKWWPLELHAGWHLAFWSPKWDFHRLETLEITWEQALQDASRGLTLWLESSLRGHLGVAKLRAQFLYQPILSETRTFHFVPALLHISLCQDYPKTSWEITIQWFIIISIIHYPLSQYYCHYHYDYHWIILITQTALSPSHRTTESPGTPRSCSRAPWVRAQRTRSPGWKWPCPASALSQQHQARHAWWSWRWAVICYDIGRFSENPLDGCGMPWYFRFFAD